MYDVAHIFLRWLVYKFCVSDMWKQIFCASQILVWCDIKILLLSLKVSFDSFVFWLLHLNLFLILCIFFCIFF